MSQSDKTSSTSAFPWKEVLAFLGMILAAYIGFLGIRSQIEIPIQATQTVEARLTEFANISGTSQIALVTETPNIIFSNPVSTETPAETPRPTNTSTLTLIPVAQTPANTLSLSETLKPDCIYSTNQGTGGNVTIQVSTLQKVSQIIISMSEKASKDPTWGYSLFEVQAFGEDTNLNLVSGGKAEASTTQQEFFAEKVIDGNQKDPSRWSSEPSDSSPQKLTITLYNPPQLINSIVLYWERAYAVTYEVCISP